jgi:hypothetical protein
MDMRDRPRKAFLRDYSRVHTSVTDMTLGVRYAVLCVTLLMDGLEKTSIGSSKFPNFFGISPIKRVVRPLNIRPSTQFAKASPLFCSYCTYEQSHNLSTDTSDSFIFLPGNNSTTEGFQRLPVCPEAELSPATFESKIYHSVITWRSMIRVISG